MRHASSLPSRRLASVSSDSTASPFDRLDAALMHLAAGPHPLTLPAALLSDSVAQGHWPVDLIRARMAHPSTPTEARDRVWAEILHREAVLGEPWGAVALAMSLPMLRRVARLPHLAEVETQELQQEVLTAVTGELAVVAKEVEAGPGAEVGLRLVRAGDRAASRSVRIPG